MPKRAQAMLGEQRLLWDRDRRLVLSVPKLMTSSSPYLMHFQLHPAVAGITPGISPPWCPGPSVTGHSHCMK